MKLQWIIFAVPFLFNNVDLGFGAPMGICDFHPGAGIDFSGMDGGGDYSVRSSSSSSYSGDWDNKDAYLASTKPITKDGERCTEVTICGKGIYEIMDFPSSAGDMECYLCDDDLLVANQYTVLSYSMYSKKPETMQVIQDGQCVVKTYTTSNGETSATTYPVVGAACDDMKNEHLQRLQQWQKWEVETFPPGFPFCDDNSPQDFNANIDHGNVNGWTTPVYGYTEDPYSCAAPSSGNPSPFTLPIWGLGGGSGSPPGIAFGGAPVSSKPLLEQGYVFFISLI